MPELPPPPQPPPSPSDRLRGWAASQWAAAPASTRRRLGAGAALTVLVAVAVAVVAGGGAGPEPELTLPDASAMPAPAGREPVHVHGAGALVRPGLYRLAAGSRVADLIEAAGGPVADADVHRLNLAARLVDGDRIYVPRIDEALDGAADGGAADAGDGGGAGLRALDLNAATQAQLEELPGIGPATATAILDERKRRGRFKSVEELLEVRGIGPAKLDQIRELVRV